MITTNLPNNLRAWRRANEFTLADASQKIGLSKVHLQRLEVGTRDLTISVMERAARAYGCKVADLLLVEDGGLEPIERALVECFRAANKDARSALLAVADSLRSNK